MSGTYGAEEVTMVPGCHREMQRAVDFEGGRKCSAMMLRSGVLIGNGDVRNQVCGETPGDRKRLVNPAAVPETNGK
jgi:hypothetical protein